MNPTIDCIETKELAARNGDGLEVRLLWHPRSNDVWVEIVDERRDERMEFAVPPHRALDAFQHPFAYAARAGELDDAGALAAITF
jgi:hypothetical protein